MLALPRFARHTCASSPFSRYLDNIYTTNVAFPTFPPRTALDANVLAGQLRLRSSAKKI